MATEKISLTLEASLLAQARERVGRRGLSGYVNRALDRQLQHDRLTGLLADLEDEFGPVDPDVMEEVRQEWPDPAESLRRSA